MVGERGAQPLRIADQRAAGFERRVEPLVGIDGDRIGEAEGPQVVGSLGHRRGESAVGAVDMEPDAVLPAEGGDLGQRVDGAGAHRSGGADHQTRHVAGGDVGLDLPPERADVHPELAVGGNPADRLGAEPSHVSGLLQPGVGLGRAVDPQPAAGTAVHTERAHVPVRGGAARAAMKQMTLAMLPPLVSSPPHAGG